MSLLTQAQAKLIEKIGKGWEQISKSEADAFSQKVGSAIEAESGNEARAKYRLGAMLNAVASGSLVEASVHEIDKRNYEDGRVTKVSVWVASYAPNIDRRRYAEAMAYALRSDQLEDAGIESTQFNPTTFKNLATDTTADAFTEVVSGMLADVAEADEPVTIDRKAFVAAGRDAGIVAKASGGGSSDPLMKAANALLKELAKADKLTAVQKRLLKNVDAKVTEILG